MPFHSAGFLLLLLPTFLAYYMIRTERWQHLVLFVASFAFYWFAGVRDLLVLLGTVYLCFLLSSQRAGRVVAVVMSLLVLAYFKYRFFLSDLVGVRLFDAVDYAIPLGISFYVFQLIAYQVDLMRGHVERERSFGKLLLYVLFFPHHQAGPIMRPATFLPQFYGAKPFDADGIARGVAWILYGLVQKVIADQIGEIATPLFDSAPTSMATAWAAPLTFAVQIYGDFAGYSNMAVGLGLLFGYQLDRNFNQPYLARSPSEFWTRWHMTLSAWFRDYLYIPLGGNRGGSCRTYFNLLATMTVAGLWHGPSLNFVLWGLLHGVVLCAFRWARAERLPVVVSWGLCQVCVVALWVPFRAQSLDSTLALWRAMAGIGVPLGGTAAWLTITLAIAAFMGVHAIEEFALASRERAAGLRQTWQRVPAMARGAIAAGVLAGLALFLQDRTTFIYFRF